MESWTYTETTLSLAVEGVIVPNATTFSATQSGTSVTARVSLLSWRSLVYCSLAHFKAFYLRMAFAGTTPKPGDLLTYIYRDSVRAVQSASTSQLLPECVAPT